MFRPTASQIFFRIATESLVRLAHTVIAGESRSSDSRRCTRAVPRSAALLASGLADHLQHVFQSGVGNVPESDDAVARIGTFLGFLLGL